MVLEQQIQDNSTEREEESQKLIRTIARGLAATDFDQKDLEIFDQNGEVLKSSVPDSIALIDMRFRYFLVTEIYIDKPDFKNRVAPAMDYLDFQLTQYMVNKAESSYEDREIDLGYLENLYEKVLARLREHVEETGEDLSEESSYLTEGYTELMALRSEMAQAAVGELMAEINTPKPPIAFAKNEEGIEDDALASN
ncbi:hypothetical protein HOG48_00750 [Candidatus Peregrinibacteria bacterium]|jgi:hypothetical protein|nr:hypothetical protein [Candidatus Peregrinibacteria bacterium]